MFPEKKHMQWKTKNVKTGPGLRANPAFGLGPKAAPRPSHGQARKDSSSMAWSLMTKRFAVFISHDTQAFNLRRSAFYCFFTRLKKKFPKNCSFRIKRLRLKRQFLVTMRFTSAVQTLFKMRDDCVLVCQNRNNHDGAEPNYHGPALRLRSALAMF